MLQWLKTSQFGRIHGESEGNHGVWQDVFESHLAYFVRDFTTVKEIVERAKIKRVAKQIEPNGSMPRELERATSLHYSAYNLEAFFFLSRIAEKVGVDLWNYQTKDGRSNRKALDFIVEPAVGMKPWSHTQNSPFDPYPFFSFLLLKAGEKYGPQYIKYFEKLDQTTFESVEPRLHVIFP